MIKKNSPNGKMRMASDVIRALKSIEKDVEKLDQTQETLSTNFEPKMKSRSVDLCSSISDPQENSYELANITESAIVRYDKASSLKQSL